MKKVLIIDKNPIFAMKIASLLQEHAAAYSCSDARLLEELLVREDWDAVAADLLLPGLDGLRLPEMVRMRSKNCRILVLSAVYSEYLWNYMEKYDISYMLLRPCEAWVVAGILRSLLGESRPVSPERTAMHLLGSLGIPTRMRGYRYLRCALGIRENISFRVLCERIGNQWGSPPEAVERAMRSAVCAAWNQREDSLWALYFPAEPGSEPRKPGTEQLVCILRKRMEASACGEF